MPSLKLPVREDDVVTRLKYNNILLQDQSQYGEHSQPSMFEVVPPASLLTEQPSLDPTPAKTTMQDKSSQNADLESVQDKPSMDNQSLQKAQ